MMIGRLTVVMLSHLVVASATPASERTRRRKPTIAIRVRPAFSNATYSDGFLPKTIMLHFRRLATSPEADGRTASRSALWFLRHLRTHGRRPAEECTAAVEARHRRGGSTRPRR